MFQDDTPTTAVHAAMTLRARQLLKLWARIYELEAEDVDEAEDEDSSSSISSSSSSESDDDDNDNSTNDQEPPLKKKRT